MRHLIFNPHAMPAFFALKGLTTKVSQRAYLAALSDDLRCTDKTFTNWFQYGHIRCDLLLTFCNLAHFHLRYFVAYEGTDNSPASRYYRLESEATWVPCGIRLDFLIAGLAVRRNMSRRDICRTYGLKNYIRSFERNDSDVLRRKTFNELLQMMDHPWMEPWEYLRDVGEPFPTSPDSASMPLGQSRYVMTPMEKLRQKNNTLHLQLNEINMRIEDTEKECKENERLIASLRVDICDYEITLSDIKKKLKERERLLVRLNATLRELTR